MQVCGGVGFRVWGLGILILGVSWREGGGGRHVFSELSLLSRSNPHVDCIALISNAPQICLYLDRE